MIKKTLKINGVERILILDKDETLAQVLRDHLLLTGCKIGCGQSLRIRFLPDNIQEPGSPLDLTLLLSPAPDPGHSLGQ